MGAVRNFNTKGQRVKEENSNLLFFFDPLTPLSLCVEISYSLKGIQNRKENNE